MAPIKNPMAEGKTFVKPVPGDISIAGESKLQKLAATMTPPVKPSMPSSTLLRMVRKKNTVEAPKAVIAHVNNVAISAAQTGFMVSNQAIQVSNPLCINSCIVIVPII